MADSVIECPRRDTGLVNLTCNWPTKTSFEGSVRKWCGVVNIHVRLADTNAETVAQGTLTVVPEGFRPSRNIPIMAISRVSGVDRDIPISAWLYTDGTIPVSVSSSRKLEEITLIGAYPVA